MRRGSARWCRNPVAVSKSLIPFRCRWRAYRGSRVTAKFTVVTVITQPVPFGARYPLFMRIALVAVWILGPLSLSAAIRMSLIRWGGDAHAYWVAVQAPLGYSRGPGYVDAFLYSPVFADLVRPLGLLPWPVFWLLWVALEGAALAWLLNPLPIRWSVPLWLLCTPELMNGNIYLFLAVAGVVGMRHPAAWVFPVLTKVVSGVGLLWFAVRGEWRRLAVAVGALIAVVAISYLFEPDAWAAWVAFLLRWRNAANDGQGGMLLRWVLAVVLVAFAARTGRSSLLPVAMVVANPIEVLTMLTMLTAIPRLRLLDEGSLNSWGPLGLGGSVSPVPPRIGRFGRRVNA